MSAGLMRRGLPPSPPGVAAPADKRFRRSDVRQARRRGLRAAFRRAAWWAAGGLVVLALLGWAGTQMLESPALHVRQLTITGNVHLSRADVEMLLSGIREESLFSADLGAYQARVMESPWVRSVVLRRRLPATLEVTIVERMPLALARVKQQLYLIDGQGVIIGPYGPQYREFDLPIVDGLTGPGAGPGEPVDAGRIALVERLLADLAGRGDLLRRLSQVDVSDPRDAVVLLDREPALLHLGDQDFRQRLELYEDIAPSLHQQFGVMEYIELRHGRNVAVRPRASPEPAAEAGKQSSTEHTRAGGMRRG